MYMEPRAMVTASFRRPCLKFRKKKTKEIRGIMG